MDTDRPIYEYEDTPSLVARTLIVSRFPAFEKHILEAFRNSSSFRELCEDYQSVFVCLNEMSLPDNMAKSFDEKYLKELKHGLEQEFFQYFKLFKVQPKPKI